VHGQECSTPCKVQGQAVKGVALQADIEESMAVLGRDWQPNGIKSNQKMIKTLCDEEYNQGIIAAPLDSTSVFADFEKLMET